MLSRVKYSLDARRDPTQSEPFLLTLTEFLLEIRVGMPPVIEVYAVPQEEGAADASGDS